MRAAVVAPTTGEHAKTGKAGAGAGAAFLKERRKVDVTLPLELLVMMDTINSGTIG